MAQTPRRYLLTEQQVLAAVDAVVTLPGSAVAALVQYLEARPELAPGWLQTRPPSQQAPQQHECPECEAAHTRGYREGRALERERKRKLKAALDAALAVPQNQHVIEELAAKQAEALDEWAAKLPPVPRLSLEAMNRDTIYPDPPSREPTGAERYFAEQMRDANFASAYHAERGVLEIEEAWRRAYVSCDRVQAVRASNLEPASHPSL